MKLKNAFTLAEVLVTLSVIGLIAMLTLPALVKNYKNKLYAASIEKTYSQLTDAVQNVVNDEMATSFSKTTAGVVQDESETCATATTGVCWFMRNYLKVAPGMVDCTTESAANAVDADGKKSGQKVCIADEYRTPNGDGPTVFTGQCVQLVNGAAVCMVLNPANGVVSVFLDTNGPAQPNQTGVDAFVMNISGSTNSIIDWSTDGTKCNTKSSGYNHAADYATGCLTKVMNAGWKIED